MGPLWLLVGPSLFITLLGLVYAEVGAIDPVVFIPHLALGWVRWTLINGFTVGSATVFQRTRRLIL